MLMYRISQALTRVYLRYPYFAYPFSFVQFVQSTQIPTIGISEDWIIYYNKEFINKLTIDELAAALIHEISHVLRDHAQRAHIATDMKVWNLAADAEINDDIANLPEGSIYPYTFNMPPYRSAEEYYQVIYNIYHHILGSDGGSLSDSGAPEQRLPSTAAVAVAVPSWAQMLPSIQPNMPEQNSPDAHGSGVTGKKAEWETETQHDFSRTKREVIIRETAGEIIKSAGHEAGSWRRWAESILMSKQSWETLFRQHLQMAVEQKRGYDDVSYARPSRRHREIFIPDHVAPKYKVALIMDTSGSMQTEDLNYGLGVIRDIIAELDTEIVVLSVDTTVHTQQTVFSSDEVTLCGGGGTDMRVGIKHVEENNLGDIIVVFTDGWTDWPESSSLPVIAVLTTNEEVPAWITAIRYANN